MVYPGGAVCSKRPKEPGNFYSNFTKKAFEVLMQNIFLVIKLRLVNLLRDLFR